MGILNVDNIQPVGGGTTITLNSSEINVGAGITFESNGQANFAGVVTATSFSGSGANLTSLPSQVTINNASANRVLTSDGGTTLNGEANLLFDGGTLALNGRYQRGSATVQDGDAIAGGININGLDMDASVIMSVFGNDGDFTRISGSKSRNASVGSHTIVQNNDVLLSLKGFGSDGTNFEEAAQIEMQVDGTPNNNVMPGRIVFKTTTTDGVAERLRITSAGDLLFKKTSSDDQVTGVQFDHHGLVRFTKDNIVAYFIRTGSDGQMIRFYGDTSSEGSINISGTSISYNGGVLSRWSQIVGISTNNKADRPTIYQGTVMSNLDEMCEWGDEENMQLNKTQVSNVSGDKNVAGVFWAWDDDDDTYLNDYYIAQTGDYIIRVGAATTVTRGDLLESAGDGTAKPQSDDIVRSKTVAKVTSGIAHTTYPDGTKTYPCVLMAS